MVGANGTEKLRLQLWDTAGQERFRKSMVSHYYRSVRSFVHRRYIKYSETSFLSPET